MGKQNLINSKNPQSSVPQTANNRPMASRQANTTMSGSNSKHSFKPLHRPVPGKILPGYSTSLTEETREVASVTCKNTNQVTGMLNLVNQQINYASITEQRISQGDTEQETSFTTFTTYPEKIDQTINEASRMDCDLKKRIPATKFTISQSAVKIFNNPRALSEEIINHKKVARRNIKKAAIYGNLVIIATDDVDTKKILEEEWPTNAFIHGVRKPMKNPQKQTNSLKMVIFAKDAEIDLECTETKDQLSIQGILEAKHLVSKNKENQNTGIIKIIVENREKA